MPQRVLLCSVKKMVDNSWSILPGSSVNLGSMKIHRTTFIWMESFRKWHWFPAGKTNRKVKALWGALKHYRSFVGDVFWQAGFWGFQAACSACLTSVVPLWFTDHGSQFNPHLHRLPPSSFHFPCSRQGQFAFWNFSTGYVSGNLLST